MFYGFVWQSSLQSCDELTRKRVVKITDYVALNLLRISGLTNCEQRIMLPLGCCLHADYWNNEGGDNPLYCIRCSVVGDRSQFSDPFFEQPFVLIKHFSVEILLCLKMINNNREADVGCFRNLAHRSAVK